MHTQKNAAGTVPALHRCCWWYEEYDDQILTAVSLDIAPVVVEATPATPPASVVVEASFFVEPARRGEIGAQTHVHKSGTFC